MRKSGLCVASLALLLFVGCGNADEAASMDESSLGVKAFKETNYSKAVEHFRKATSLYPQNHFAWYNLGKTMQVQKKWEEAAKAFSEAAKHNDKDPMYRYDLGFAQYQARNLSEAETQLEEAVNLEKRLYKAHYFLGKVYSETDRPKEAAESWSTAAKLSPFFGKPFIELGRLYLKWDMLPQAISVLDQGRLHVKDRQEVSDIYLTLGVAYDAQQNWDKAIEAYTKALEYRPENVEAKLQRGFAAAEKGDKAAAKKDLEEFVKVGGGGNAFNIQAANDRLMRMMMDE